MKWCKKDNCGYLIFKAVTVFCFCVFTGRGTFYKFDFFAGKKPKQGFMYQRFKQKSISRTAISVFLL